MNLPSNAGISNGLSNSFDKKIEDARASLTKLGLTPTVLENARQNGQSAAQALRQLLKEKATIKKETPLPFLKDSNPDLDAILSEWVAFHSQIEALRAENLALRRENAQLKSKLQKVGTDAHAPHIQAA